MPSMSENLCTNYKWIDWIGGNCAIALNHGALAKENKFGLTLRMVAAQKGNCGWNVIETSTSYYHSY